MTASPTSGFSPPPPERLTGSVERVTFHNEESGFAVLRVKVRGRRDLVTVVGSVPAISAGEWIEAEGRWMIDPTHGQQFRAEGMRVDRPHSRDGIERYLASGVIRGIGPAFAARLVATFGTEVFTVIEQTPERLAEIPGIGPARRAAMVAAWETQREVREIMVFLASHGVSGARAFRIYKTFGHGAIERVREDPYALAREVRGIGFASADAIAARVGIPRDSPLRARAAIEHVLAELANQGHCAFPHDRLVRRAAELLDLEPPLLEDAVRTGIASGRLMARRFGQAGAADNDLIFLAALDSAERLLAANLDALARGCHPCPAIDIAKAIPWVEHRLDLTLAAAQREALALVTTAKVAVLTGGPGVGKTTLLRAILAVFRAKGLAVVLAAPTGRAARRITETTGVAASTIHRLLEVDAASGRFKHDGEHPLAGDVFIVDEASMIDLPLGHALVRAIPPPAALLLVGDVDQLPSVGPGAVLADVIAAGTVPVCRLTEVFRQASASAIVRNAHRINHGELPLWPRKGSPEAETSDFFLIAAEQPEVALERIVALVRDDIPRRFHLDPRADIQVLTPMQRGELGARNLNVRLQEALNPVGPAVERFGWTFRLGDRVMQTANDYDKEVFNGDVGLIAVLDAEGRELAVRFDDRTVRYGFDELDDLQLAYASTVHKSQGSEYPAVVIPIHTQHFVMLQRNLLYTAITRGRRLVVIVGSPQAVAIAVKRGQAARRITALADRLRARARDTGLYDRESNAAAGLPRAAELPGRQPR